MNDSRAVARSQRTIYQGRIFTVSVDRVRLPHGREVDMEVVRHPPSVVLLPMPDAARVILVRQYRYAIDRWIWELPAGSLDPGETPERAAARECEEEIGLVPARLERVGTFYPTPGYCDEAMIFFRLTGLAAPAAGSPPAVQDEDECLAPKAFTLDEARRLVRDGEIVDMKTVVGLTLIDGSPRS